MRINLLSLEGAALMHRFCWLLGFSDKFFFFACLSPSCDSVDLDPLNLLALFIIVFRSVVHCLLSLTSDCFKSFVSIDSLFLHKTALKFPPFPARFLHLFYNVPSASGLTFGSMPSLSEV